MPLSSCPPWREKLFLIEARRTTGGISRAAGGAQWTTFPAIRWWIMWRIQVGGTAGRQGPAVTWARQTAFCRLVHRSGNFALRRSTPLFGCSYIGLLGPRCFVGRAGRRHACLGGGGELVPVWRRARTVAGACAPLSWAVCPRHAVGSALLGPRNLMPRYGGVCGLGIAPPHTWTHSHISQWWHAPRAVSSCAAEERCCCAVAMCIDGVW